MDFLWHDTTIKKGDLSKFKLSHYSPGPGYVYARSSWDNYDKVDDDATYFFFKCGNRFTAHQHLDVGTFLIYKEGELVSDGGHYDDFGGRSLHDVNYHLRTVAHSTIRVVDPAESWAKITWPGGYASIRAADGQNGRASITANDGGQRYDWPLQNGGATDADHWNELNQKPGIRPNVMKTGQILTFEDKGDHVFIKADCTDAYSSTKLESFVRQIIFQRPDTFIFVDTVRVTDPKFRPIWTLQAMNSPTRDAKTGMMTWSGVKDGKDGNGHLLMQTLLPEKTNTMPFIGDKLYMVNGTNYPPQRSTGPAPKCRIEISPKEPKKEYVFVNVFRTSSGERPSPTSFAKAAVSGGKVRVTVDGKQPPFEFEVPK
jgi:heparin/heparan-sulfate lyase